MSIATRVQLPEIHSKQTGQTTKFKMILSPTINNILWHLCFVNTHPPSLILVIAALMSWLSCNLTTNTERPVKYMLVLKPPGFVLIGVGVSCHILYSIISNLYVSCSRLITSVGEERANISAILWILFREVSSSSWC